MKKYKVIKELKVGDQMTIQQFISAMFEKWSHRHRFVKTE